MGRIYSQVTPHSRDRSIGRPRLCFPSGKGFGSCRSGWICGTSGLAACLSEAFLLAAAGAPREDREKLRILSFLVGVYVLGGVVGATAYLVMGFYFALPLAALLLALSLPSLLKRTRLSRRR